MKNFDTRTYNVSDFIEWNETGYLELSPDFQRRYVWSEKAKSYLIDTIIRGKPIPKILIQQKLQGRRNTRVVVDGQQRLRTLLGFYNGDFKISRVHNKEYAGKTYADLPIDVQNEFLKYELGVDLLFDMPYEDLLDIFARLNSYTAKLTKQEIFNARYVGHFKQAAFRLGLKYVRYIINAGILTKSRVSRMGESELTSDLLVSLIDGVQSNKVIESFYKKYEDEKGEVYSKSKEFDQIMTDIGELYKPEDLSNTNWRRPPQFYTLFTVIGHSRYGLKHLDISTRFDLTSLHSRVRLILDEISGMYDAYLDDKDNPAFDEFKQFMFYSQRATTDSAARIYRANFVCSFIGKRI